MTLAIQLPVLDEYRTSQNVDLDGTKYTIRINWNDRQRGWYLDLSDSTGPIVSGRRLATNWPLLAKDTTRRGPAGELLFYATRGTLEPGEDLSGYRLFYYSLEDLAAL